MNHVILRFILKGGAFLNVVTTMQVARKAVADWKAGAMRDRISSDEYPPDSLPWSLDSQQIALVQVVPLEAMQGQQPPPQSPPPGRGSGYTPFPN